MENYQRPRDARVINTRRTALARWLDANHISRRGFADHHRFGFKTIACLAEPDAYARVLREIPVETLERITEITGIPIGTLVEDYSRERPRPAVAAQ